MPLTVWLAVLVMRSLPLVPVSALMVNEDTAGRVELPEPDPEPEPELLELPSDELVVTVTFTVVPEPFLAPDKPNKPKAPRELVPPLVSHAKKPPESSSSSSSDFFLPFLAACSVLCL